MTTAPQTLTGASRWTPVSRIPQGLLQRKCDCGQHTITGGECEQCKDKQTTLQRHPIGSAGQMKVPPIVHEALRSPGQPLDVETLSVFEPRFGHDFSQVRVHTDEKATESAKALDALAYSSGKNLVFEQGQYAPESPTGQRLLEHELTHIVERAPGIARDKDPTEHPEPEPVSVTELKIRGVEQALAYKPKLRPHVPQAPSGTVSWTTRLRLAIGLPDTQRKEAFLDLMNEALAADASRYPELQLPVKLFISDKHAQHGDVLLDVSVGIPGSKGLEADTRPADDKLTQPPRIFIVMTPVAMDPNEGPSFTQEALNHEYVHFQQKLNRQLMVRPACVGAWKGQRIGGNPNREVLAIAITFPRFFVLWAQAGASDPAKAPRSLWTDLALLQAYFPCVDSNIRSDVLSRIAATVADKPDWQQLLSRIIVDVQSRALPSTTLLPEDNAMLQLARLVEMELVPDPRLPAAPSRPASGPLFDVNKFIQHHQGDLHKATIKSVEAL